MKRSASIASGLARFGFPCALKISPPKAQSSGIKSVTAELPGAARPFLRFETLTLAPFDRNLIDPALLDPWELDWLNAYHARVRDELAPLVDAPTREWLIAATAALG